MLTYFHKYFFVTCLSTIVGCVMSSFALAQNYYPGLTDVDKKASSTSAVHTCFKPYTQQAYDSIGIGEYNSGASYWSGDSSMKLAYYPVINFLPYYNSQSQDIGQYTLLGSGADLCWRKKLSLNFNLLGGALTPPDSMLSHIDSTRIIPHFGRDIAQHRKHHFFFPLTGSLSYTPNQYFNFRLGYDRHFWGDGYRSLILSDNSNAYAFFKASVSIRRFKYVVMYTFLNDIDGTGDNNDLLRKYATLHAVSWNVFEWLNINVFEAVIWQSRDPVGDRGFEANYLNPVIFFRPVEFTLGSPDNALLGGGIKIKVFGQTYLYGQGLLDEFDAKHVFDDTGYWGNKYALQAGLKTFDLARIEKLYAQLEYNRVRPYTYAHDEPLNNYGHYGQPLAHPLGANFEELVFRLSYRKERIAISYRSLFAHYGADIDSINYGQDIYRSYNDSRIDWGVDLGQGQDTKVFVNELLCRYNLIPRFDVNIELRLLNRLVQINSQKTHQAFVFLGLSTPLLNNYLFDYFD